MVSYAHPSVFVTTIEVGYTAREKTFLAAEALCNTHNVRSNPGKLIVALCSTLCSSDVAGSVATS